MSKHTLGLSLVAVLLLGTATGSPAAPHVEATPSPAPTVSKPTKEPERFIQSGSPIDYPNIPVVDLAAAVAKDSQHQLFRIVWFFSAGGFSSNGVALYNRKTGTIKEFITDNYDGTGDIRNSLYSRVSDAMLQKMSREIGRKGSGPFSFRYLTRYGAIQTK